MNGIGNGGKDEYGVFLNKTTPNDDLLLISGLGQVVAGVGVPLIRKARTYPGK